MPPLRLATFNINNIAKRLPVLLEWLTKASPDIVCLQEIKVPDAGFPRKDIEAIGYGARWVGQRSWNGVAILAKGMTPVETRRQLPGDPSDTQSRYLEAAAHGVLIGCLYAPNGNPQPGPKFAYKLAWMRRLLVHADTLRATGHPVALIGDYNVVPTDFDIYNPRSWLKNALLQPEPRALYQQLLAQGWTDAIRASHPEDRVYTFWDYLRQAWERNAGLRLDHILLSASVAAGLRDAGSDAWVRGLPGASDHAPAWAVIETDRRLVDEDEPHAGLLPNDAPPSEVVAETSRGVPARC
jgi:exodeoxyribonuclease III